MRYEFPLDHGGNLFDNEIVSADISMHSEMTNTH